MSSSSTITFGVELEFNLAYTLQDQPPDPKQTRQLYFPSIPADHIYWRSNFVHPLAGGVEKTISEDDVILKSICVSRTLASLIHNIAGYPVPGVFGNRNPAVWQVATDHSVKAPMPTAATRHYRWLPMEIKSPALPFSAASLQQVAHVCALLSDSFVVDAGVESAGLHVHVSAGSSGRGKTFAFSTMHALLMLLWTCEPQFQTLHPPHRQPCQNPYARSLRAASRLAFRYQSRRGQPPTVLQGLAELATCTTLVGLLDQATHYSRIKFMACNFLNAWQFARDDGLCDDIPTVEFRAHEGTLDGERVVQWVSLICGLVQKLGDIHPESLAEMLQVVAKCETWQKVGDPATDAENERRFGPVLAESGFTVIDLLSGLGLEESAAYYRTRLFPVTNLAGCPC
ncbi:uncharacterized protein L3040_008497 [Drepanopeziza brunnea f. sp. 'multigermtubi']|uniref:uncharacterized protein n=1 Tax=Drepanopeziza brunnea f. sp. 'multigermtubi' TaxID=698441 RepID=UPI002391627A|nr:hypothetical protein L3040_008497 [Drepanopeziza brunnea f. sp. 'multigermtubi']